ncbi:aromatic ring-hydroxylating oxygenase subunit alpha [Novosphingobium huizhouense]|uniref:aromatic ring-hydroxylating oxygenase subunit alpha n=1 Tax=Novosphingobium huizhouense TaxID=2866625 RepID=UPI001CD9000C|nr:aromatic ring-hydroxylating dioxygenase subunit alpha [Novosphingobium huizhouense]
MTDIDREVDAREAPISGAARSTLEKHAAALLRHTADGTFPLAAGVMPLEADHYTSAERFAAEKRFVFQRVPLTLAASCEIPEAGDYKTLEVAGIPVLLVRDRQGKAHVLLNACTHRGAAVASGCGTAARFTCPYHGWTFSQDGALIGIASADDFGRVYKALLSMKRFPVAERAGLIWAILDPASPHNPAKMLSGIDDLISGFGLADWSVIESRILTGPNWKLAFDAHLEFYHLPVLHRETFGPQRSNRAFYFAQGPHQRVIAPQGPASERAPDDLYAFGRVPTRDEPLDPLLMGEWILFPGTSINTFYIAGIRCVLLSIVVPGAEVDTSTTTQTFLAETPPQDDTARSAMADMTAFLAHVVGDEDMPTSAFQQQVMGTGLLGEVRFGRNEGGLQHFHMWLDRVIAADDAALMELLCQP